MALLLPPALSAQMEPFMPFLGMDDVTEVSVNRPQEVWLARQGQPYMVPMEAPALTFRRLEQVAKLIANYSKQGFDADRPLLSASLGGTRVQICGFSTVRQDHVVFSFRRHMLLELSLDDYAGKGAFRHTNKDVYARQQTHERLRQLYDAEQWVEFLTLAVQSRQNILISAGTDTGKTTMLNTLCRLIPAEERLVSIEDAEELKLSQLNAVRLFYSRGGQGAATVTPLTLLQACLRLRMNRILFGELRGAEADDYLRAVNSGHDGSITTIHANSPELAYVQVANYAMEANPGGRTLQQVIDYAKQIVPIVVQMTNTGSERLVSEIHYAA